MSSFSLLLFASCISRAGEHRVMLWRASRYKPRIATYRASFSSSVMLVQ